MIKLNLPREPHWITLAAGVRLHVRPATTALVMAARHAASKVAGTNTAAAGERTAILITELAQLAVLAWEAASAIEVCASQLRMAQGRVVGLDKATALDLFPAVEAGLMSTLSDGE